MEINPMFDRVLIELKQKENKTASGLLIPDTSTPTMHNATVVAVGDGVKDEPMILKVGDEVLVSAFVVNNHSDKVTEDDKKEMYIVRQMQISAIVK